MNDPKPENKTKKAVMVAMALCMEFFGLSLVGIFGGQYVGGLAGQATVGALTGFVLGCAIWIWRLVSTKRYIL
jgi:hypothetical protein